MKCFVATILALLTCCVNSQLVLELPRNENGLNLREIITHFFTFLTENKDSVPACGAGLELRAVGDYWKCVARTESQSQKKELLVPLCPVLSVCSSDTSCSKGFQLQRHGKNCCCVSKTVAVQDDLLPVAAAQPTIVVQCPEAEICPQNPSCTVGCHLLKHGKNCCCVKEDVYLNNETDKQDDGPKICPTCSPSELGDVDCSCIMPKKQFISSIDSTLKCCLEN